VAQTAKNVYCPSQRRPRSRLRTPQPLRRKAVAQVSFTSHSTQGPNQEAAEGAPAAAILFVKRIVNQLNLVEG
jgi:hypothetical protein